MKKVVLLVLLTCAVLAHYVNLAILSSPLSGTSKVLILMSLSFGCSSVALLAILALLGTWRTTKKQGGLNRLSHLKKMEVEIGNRKKTVKTSDWQDQWEELNEREAAMYRKRESIELTKGTDILFPLINPLKENHNV